MRLDPRVLSGGHRWRRCSSCGREAITLKDGETCRQTAAIAKRRKLPDGTEAIRWICEGKVLAPDAPAGKGEGVCEREGCGQGVRVTTAIGEGVCLRCLAQLAELGPITA